MCIRDSCSIDGFKDDAMKAIEGVEWIPEWGEERIKGMVRDRSAVSYTHLSRKNQAGIPPLCQTAAYLVP